MRAVGIVLLLVLVAGCTGREGAQPPAPSPPATEPPDVVADWTDPFEVVVPNGWTVRECLGDAPDLCVHHGGLLVGNVELAAYPRDAHEQGIDDRAVAVGRAESFLRHFRADRAAGCPAFAFAADDVSEATVGGQPAVRTGFTLAGDGGRAVERVVVHFTVAGGTVWLIHTDAYAEEGGCLPPSDTDVEFQPDDLEIFEPYLDDLVAGAPLPPADS